MNEYVVAIPSYLRHKELQNKTLNTLKRHGIYKDKIFIFVANQNEKDIYTEYLDKDSYYEIVIGEKGIRNQRKFISKFFKEGLFVISMDDDIEEFYFRISDKEQQPLNNLQKFFNNAYNTLKENNAYLFGVYPVNNPYFNMKNQISTDLQFIIGVFHGYINRHDNDLYPHIDSESKEDYEQSILFYKKDSKIIRFNNIRFKTKFNAVGGLGKDRYEMNRRAQEYLVDTYPEYVKAWDRKNGTPEVKLIKQK
jgi:hypothetical protein